MITSFEEDKIQLVAWTRFHAFIIPDSRWEMLQILGLWYSWLRNGAVQKDLTLSDSSSFPALGWVALYNPFMGKINMDHKYMYMWWIIYYSTCSTYTHHMKRLKYKCGSQVYGSHTVVKLHTTGTVWHQYSSQVWCIN